MENITDIEILKYIKELTESIIINTEANMDLNNFSQIIAKTVLETQEMATNTYNTMAVILKKVSSDLNFITATQEGIINVIDSIIEINKFSVIIDSAHTVAIIVLIIYTIYLHSKIKKVK